MSIDQLEKLCNAIEANTRVHEGRLEDKKPAQYVANPDLMARIGKLTCLLESNTQVHQKKDTMCIRDEKPGVSDIKEATRKSYSGVIKSGVEHRKLTNKNRNSNSENKNRNSNNENKASVDVSTVKAQAKGKKQLSELIMME